MCASTYHVCLQETSVVRLVAKLWTSVSMMKRILKINLNKCKSMPSNLRNAVFLKLMDLNALSPESKRKVQTLTKPVGDSIFAWLQGHSDFFNSLEEAINFCPNLRWCSNGTIDNRATAEIMLEFEEIDYMKRFILACIYCFEPQIVVFWKQLKLLGQINIDKKTAFKYPLANYWLEFLKHTTSDQIDSVSLDTRRSNLLDHIVDCDSEVSGDNDIWECVSRSSNDGNTVSLSNTNSISRRRKNNRVPVSVSDAKSITSHIVCPTLLDKMSKAKLKTIVKKSGMEKEKFSEDDVINFLEFGFDKSYEEPKSRKMDHVFTKEDDDFLSYINCCPTMNVHSYNR